MSKVLVVYCSMSGNTKAAAEAVADGARSAGAHVTIKTGLQAQPADLLACDAVALGSYDAFSYMGGGLKDFFDRAFYPTQNTVAGKPYAAFLTHGGGGKAIASIEATAQSFKLKKAAEPVLVKGRPDDAGAAKLKALGAETRSRFVKLDMPDATPRKLKFIGCEIVYREACALAASGPHHVDVEFLLKGLHDLPRQDMLQKLQAAVDAVSPEAGYEAILLGYARCNDGLVGLTARSVPLVIPRAHDCITFFFGSRVAYADYFDRHPGTYFLTTGWSERNEFGESGYSRPAYGLDGVMAKLGLTEPYDLMVEKYGKDNADYIIESVGGWLKNYSRCLYLKMAVCDERPFIERARRQAQERAWEFELRDGDWSLLKKLFYADWDADFLIVPPGRTIVARNDDQVLDAQ